LADYLQSRAVLFSRKSEASPMGNTATRKEDVSTARSPHGWMSSFSEGLSRDCDPVRISDSFQNCRMGRPFAVAKTFSAAGYYSSQNPTKI
jgi:hypothetical protein